jgi:hypothetical protein
VEIYNIYAITRDKVKHWKLVKIISFEKEMIRVDCPKPNCDPDAGYPYLTQPTETYYLNGSRTRNFYTSARFLEPKSPFSMIVGITIQRDYLFYLLRTGIAGKRWPGEEHVLWI